MQAQDTFPGRKAVAAAHKIIGNLMQMKRPARGDPPCNDRLFAVMDRRFAEYLQQSVSSDKDERAAGPERAPSAGSTPRADDDDDDEQPQALRDFIADLSPGLFFFIKCALYDSFLDSNDGAQSEPRRINAMYRACKRNDAAACRALVPDEEAGAFAPMVHYVREFDAAYARWISAQDLFERLDPCIEDVVSMRVKPAGVLLSSELAGLLAVQSSCPVTGVLVSPRHRQAALDDLFLVLLKDRSGDERRMLVAGGPPSVRIMSAAVFTWNLYAFVKVCAAARFMELIAATKSASSLPPPPQNISQAVRLLIDDALSETTADGDGDGDAPRWKNVFRDVHGVYTEHCELLSTFQRDNSAAAQQAAKRQRRFVADDTP